jgi:hypothetical protein
MNQTHDVLELTLYRATEPDCIAIANDSGAALPRASFRLERCRTLLPAGLMALDPCEPPEQPPRCQAVALAGTGLAPHAVFWTDTASRDASRSGDAIIELVTVGRDLVLDPAARATLLPLASLPEPSCELAP